MPAVSEKQRRFMGMVHAFKNKKLKDAPASVKKAARTISDEDAVDFASKPCKESFAQFLLRDSQEIVE